MTIKFIATIVIALLNIFLGIFIYKRNSQNPGNINFAAMCVSGGLWAVFMAFLYFIDSNQILNYMLKGTYAFAIFVPLFYLLFAYHYPYRLWNYPPFLIRAIIAITLILEICFLSGFLNFQEFFITNGVIHQKTFFVDFLIFSIYFFSYVLWGLLILFKKLKRVEGVYRINLKYLIAATLSTFVIIGVISIIMPLLGNYTYDWLGPIFTLVHFIFVGYLLFFRDLKIVRS